MKMRDFSSDSSWFQCGMLNMGKKLLIYLRRISIKYILFVELAYM